ncbi:MAG: hypothetical protein K6G22_14880 [Lachnospiraceae bacterium]|nr:hypothetical protein [Lachnospiraceae bacterium]
MSIEKKVRRIMMRLMAVAAALLMMAGVFAAFGKSVYASDNVKASDDSVYSFIVLDNEEVPLAPTPDTLPDYTTTMVICVNLLLLTVVIAIYSGSYFSYRDRVNALAPASGRDAKRLRDSSLIWHPIKRQRYIKEYEAKLASRYI